MFNKSISKCSESGLLNIKVGLKQHKSVTRFMDITVMNLVAPKAVAEYELLFNKSVPECSEAGLLNECSCLARTLGVTKFTNMRDMFMVTLCCATKSDLNV